MIGLYLSFESVPIFLSYKKAWKRLTKQPLLYPLSACTHIPLCLGREEQALAFSAPERFIDSLRYRLAHLRPPYASRERMSRVGKRYQANLTEIPLNLARDISLQLIRYAFLNVEIIREI